MPLVTRRLTCWLNMQRLRQTLNRPRSYTAWRSQTNRKKLNSSFQADKRLASIYKLLTAVAHKPMNEKVARQITCTCLCLLIVLAGVMPIRAGGNLEELDITGFTSSPIRGQIIARTVGIKWDARAIPVQYSVNNALDPIPNPLGADFLSVAEATTALQESFDAWNGNPASFIDMQITRTTSNDGDAGFDMVNELTFRTRFAGGFIAISPSTSLSQDITLEDGDGLDTDEDADVSGEITVAADVDGDGDTEFPAGFYKAGTILDNDVEFNTNPFTLPNFTFNPNAGYRFTVDPAAIDTDPDSVDLVAVATHEFGHSHGLSHTLVNQISAADGTSATMFPAIDTNDPNSELSGRSPETDDLAYSSYYYPEGSAADGPAALQNGDVDFDEVYGLITGELRHGGLQQPIAGGSLFAVDQGSGAVVASAVSGTTQLSLNPATGELFLLNSGYAIRDGSYVMPVPKGSYTIGVEATDGFPASGPQINITGLIGFILGQQNFNEEFFNGNEESDVEDQPNQAESIVVEAGATRADINIVTNRTIDINNFGTLDFVSSNNAPAGRYYAVRIPAAQVAEVAGRGDLVIQAANFLTNVADASVAPVFAEALLTTGVVNPSGTAATLNLDEPLAQVSGFLGQDFDFAPFSFENPRELGQRVQQGIDSGEIENLFVVLRLPTTTPFPGISRVPPRIGLDGGVAQNDVLIFGLSYFSDDDGATFSRVTNFNYMFSLTFSDVAGS